MIREVWRRPGVPAAAAAGDATAVATYMRAGGYFEAPAATYALAIERNARDIAANLDEPQLVIRGGGKITPPAAEAATGMGWLALGLAAAGYAFLRRRKSA